MNEELDFSQWLLAQIDDLRAEAQSAADATTDDYRVNDLGKLLLAEIDAKRQTVELHHPDSGGWDGTDKRCQECGGYDLVAGYGARGYRTSWPCKTLKLLALPFVERDGHLKEWRP